MISVVLLHLSAIQIFYFIMNYPIILMIFRVPSGLILRSLFITSLVAILTCYYSDIPCLLIHLIRPCKIGRYLMLNILYVKDNIIPTFLQVKIGIANAIQTGIRSERRPNNAIIYTGVPFKISVLQ